MAEVGEWNQQLAPGQIIEHRYTIVFPQAEVDVGGEIINAPIVSLGQPVLSHDIPLIEAGDARILVMPPVIQGMEIVVRLFVGYGPAPTEDTITHLDEEQGTYYEEA